nr:immunoglobulin light chain junction region [Macaca mulatta]MOW39209.1 immunoglobulin light chain junction region [Macaca mulatta]MOW39428.1 immunoglobulin light chain junction region [Macaca mulatta]MOW39469.1 immunoglobulin light chain junction region [Macaca mulatta]MOW39836.1 immunoglobulin light chain junction region [Macaca mulatta]
CQNYGDSPHSF